MRGGGGGGLVGVQRAQESRALAASGVRVARCGHGGQGRMRLGVDAVLWQWRSELVGRGARGHSGRTSPKWIHLKMHSKMNFFRIGNNSKKREIVSM